jgi:MFS family permease
MSKALPDEREVFRSATAGEPAQPSPPVAITMDAILLLAFMWFAYFLNYCDRQAVFAMFPSLKTDLAMTDQQLGLTGTVFLWVYAFGCPVAGHIGDRISKRILVVLSLIIWSLVTVATGFARSALDLLSLRAAMGISESLFMPVAIALTASAFAPALRSRSIAILTTAQIAGTVVGSWFGGWMADRGAWRGAFFVLGGIGLLYATPYFLFLRRMRVDDGSLQKVKGEPFRLVSLVRISTYQILCVVFPVFVFGLWLLYGWLPSFLHDKFSLSQSEAALNAALFLQGSTAVGLLGGGFLADMLLRLTKASRYWLMIMSLILCAPSLHAIGSCESLQALRFAAVAFGLSSGLFMGNIFPAAFEVVPKNSRATAVGILNLFGGLMSGFATLFGGLWKSTLGIDGLMTLTAIAYFAAGLLLIYGVYRLFPNDYRIADYAD